MKSTLSPELIATMKQDRSDGLSLSQIAEKHSVTMNQLNYALYGKKKEHVERRRRGGATTESLSRNGHLRAAIDALQKERDVLNIQLDEIEPILAKLKMLNDSDNAQG